MSFSWFWFKVIGSFSTPLVCLFLKNRMNSRPFSIDLFEQDACSTWKIPGNRSFSLGFLLPWIHPDIIFHTVMTRDAPGSIWLDPSTTGKCVASWHFTSQLVLVWRKRFQLMEIHSNLFGRQCTLGKLTWKLNMEPWKMKNPFGENHLKLGRL